MTEPQALANGRYLLVKRLGEGGMATVYRAFDQRLQVWRAIKVLLPDYASKKKIMARFDAEAQTMALLEHPNIVRVYDVDREGNFPYIVMEIVEGGSLVDYLENHGPMPPRLAVDVIVETCQALQYAHDKGVIHRDIKPHNIMIDRDGVCRLTDFGIARAGDSDVNLTKTGAVMGTWGYMAPEQRSDAKHVEEPADVYAMAATLYSLLTDKTPMDLFAAEHDADMLDGVPEPLVPVLIKATEYNAANRYQSAQAFATALLEVRDALDDMPANTPSLKPDIVPMDKPPPTVPDSSGAFPSPVATAPGPDAGGGETILPGTTADASGSFTMMPFDDPAPAADTPSPVAASPHTTSSDPLGRTVVLALAAIVVLVLLGGGLGTYVLYVQGSSEADATAAAPTPSSSTDSTDATVGAPTPTPTVEATAPPSGATPSTPAASTPSASKPSASAASTSKPSASAASSSKPSISKPAATKPVTTPPSTDGTADAEPSAAEGSSQEAPAGTTEPEAPPEPPPPPPQCFKDVKVPSGVDAGRSLTFRTALCQKGDVTVHYRPASGGTWYKKKMPYRLGAYTAVVPVEASFGGRVDWYFSSDGKTWGSASKPHTVKVRGGSAE